MRRDDLFPFHVILSSRDRHESRRKIRSKGKMEGKVKEIGRQRRGIETVALRTCIEYLKESIYISVLSPISIFSSRRNKESKDLRSILVSPPRYEKEIYLNLWHNLFALRRKEFRFQRIDLSSSKKPRTGGRFKTVNVSCGGDFTRRFFSRSPRASQSVSQSVSFSTRKMVARRGHRWWRGNGVSEIGSRQFVALRRVASVFSRLYHGMREGRVDPEPGSRTGVMDTRGRDGGSLSHINYTRGGSSPRAILPHVPPLAACHLERIEPRRPSSFPSLETYPFRFYLSLLPNRLCPLRFSPPPLLSPRYYSSFARYPRASSLCFFVRVAASSPFLPTPFSLAPSPKTFLESSSASFFPSLPLLSLAHSSSLCISHLLAFPPLSIAYRVQIATRAFHFLPEIPLFPFLSPSSSRDLHSFPPTPVSFHLSRDSYTISFDRFVDTSDNSWQEDPKYLFWKLNARFFFFSLFFLASPEFFPFIHPRYL